MSERVLALLIGTRHEHGYGHIARGVSLTSALVKEGWFVDIITQNTVLAEAFTKTLRQGERFQLTCSETPQYGPIHRVVVVDDPGCRDIEIMTQLAAHSELLVAVQDRTESANFADLVVFPDAHTSDELVSALSTSSHPSPRILRGWDYVILSLKALATSRRELCSTMRPGVVVVAGGSDPDDSSVAVTEALLDAGVAPNSIFVQMGTDMLRLANRFRNMGVNAEPFSHQRVADAGVAVVAFGISVYECVFWGVPTMTYARDLTSSAACEQLDRSGAVTYIGMSTRIETQILNDTVVSLKAQHDSATWVGSRPGRVGKLIDGMGAERVAQEISRLMSVS